MACKDICKLCNRLILSDAVAFTPGSPSTLAIVLPDGTYMDGEKYCIVVAEPLPEGTAIDANVVITIGDGTTQFPLVNKCCEPVSACQIRYRTKYSTKVVTTASGGNFKVLGDLCGCYKNNLTALDADT